MQPSRPIRLATLFAGLFPAFSMLAVDHADARRGGSFGSRGLRTHQTVPPTRTAPERAAPVERSMSPNQGPTSAARQQTTSSAQRPGFFNGFGGSMLRGIMLGGLIGLLLGQGFGGLAGIFGLLLQVLLIVGAVMLVARMFATRQAGRPAMAGPAPDAPAFRDAAPPAPGASRGFTIPRIGTGQDPSSPAATGDDISLTQADLDTFERLLAQVQEAFGHEDHAALRRLVTPEMVSYLSEELAGNAQRGIRNDVSDVQLLQADIAESWREGSHDYATAAMRYSSRDVMRDRTTGRPVDGQPEEPTQTTELWTFVRQNGGDWRLSAIQET